MLRTRPICLWSEAYRLNSLVKSILLMEPSVVGVIAGILHHIFIQYPTQAKLFTTLYAFAATNVLFLVLLFTESDAISEGHRARFGQFARHVIIFNTFYVCSQWK